MNILTIIDKKRKGESLNLEEITYAFLGYVKGDVKDYQMSSLLMAIVINGMNDDETFYLTKVMLESGESIDFGVLSSSIVDKHSTGGVGDKTTLILGPLAASLGVTVAKMSGRGLGHTGGTIDKLESIPGFKVDLTREEFLDNAKKIGFTLSSQTGNLVPADKKIYALRDVTGTVESIPLIASSIMSKKLASGANNIVIDVKVGKGALVKTLEDAKKLSELMVAIGKRYDRKVVCVISNMEEPLGNAIGNALEVKEAIDTLQNKGPKDLNELVITLATYMVSLGLNISLEEALNKVRENLKNGSAYNKFLEFVKNQNGEIDKLSFSNKIFSIKSNKTGFINHIDALKLGNLAKDIGAGRMTKEDKIDYGVGFVLSKKVGDFVTSGDELMKVYLGKIDIRLNDLLSCFKIEEKRLEKIPLIFDVIE